MKALLHELLVLAGAADAEDEAGKTSADDARAARERRYKLIRRLVEEPELYDLEADPAEQRNLLDREATGSEPPAADLERMRAALKPYASRVARSPRRVLQLELSPQQRRHLEELGYLGPREPAP